MNDKSALQPMAAAQDDRDAAARRRDTAGYVPLDEDSSDEYSSPSGDTFSDMILKLLKQMIGGGAMSLT